MFSTKWLTRCLLSEWASASYVNLLLSHFLPCTLPQPVKYYNTFKELSQATMYPKIGAVRLCVTPQWGFVPVSHLELLDFEDWWLHVYWVLHSPGCCWRQRQWMEGTRYKEKPLNFEVFLQVRNYFVTEETGHNWRRHLPCSQPGLISSTHDAKPMFKMIPWSKHGQLQSWRTPALPGWPNTSQEPQGGVSWVF